MNAIKRLNPDEFWRQAGYGFRKVFVEGPTLSDVLPGGMSATEIVFTDHLDARRLISHHPGDVPYDWRNGIAKGMKALGEEGFYLIGMEREPPLWYVPVEEINNIYRMHELRLAHEHFMVSVNGAWAVELTFDWAIMAGTQPFMSFVDQYAPSQKETLKQFLDYWEDSGNTGSNVEWISTLFTHLYGREDAKRIIEEMIHTESIKARMINALFS